MSNLSSIQGASHGHLPGPQSTRLSKKWSLYIEKYMYMFEMNNNVWVRKRFYNMFFFPIRRPFGVGLCMQSWHQYYSPPLTTLTLLPQSIMILLSMPFWLLSTFCCLLSLSFLSSFLSSFPKVVSSLIPVESQTFRNPS